MEDTTATRPLTPFERFEEGLRRALTVTKPESDQMLAEAVAKRKAERQAKSRVKQPATK